MFFPPYWEPCDKTSWIFFWRLLTSLTLYIHQIFISLSLHINVKKTYHMSKVAPVTVWKIFAFTRLNNKPCKCQVKQDLWAESCILTLSTTFKLLLVLNFENLIQKVNETIYLSHLYISGHLTQIHKVLFIYHVQFFQKVLVSTMCWCNSIFWKFQSLLFVSIFIHYDVKNCPVCSVGIVYTILFTWKFLKNVLQ